MCGIVGFMHAKLSEDEKVRTLKRMLSNIQYRGPDESGIFFDQSIGLGSVRLSIIDLASGQQPMNGAKGRYWMVYNGELFNYIELKKELELEGVTFTTSSDTEVLLESYIHWGEKCLQKFNGQFAFAVYDRERKSLFLARDRFGERPLFYYKDGRNFVFASEIKALFSHSQVSRRLQSSGLAHVAEFWTNIPGETCFEGISQLRPGHYLRLEDDLVQIRQYHHIPKLNLGSDTNVKQNLKEALEKSVNLRMRSDVEVGTYLSGGLDSSIVTALAQKLTKRPLKTFSVTFSDKDYDESTKQNIVSKYLGTEHHTVQIRESDISEVFPEMIWHSETALFRTAAAPLYLLSKKVRDCGIKLVLTGEGADEIFAGYNIFKESILRYKMKGSKREDIVDKLEMLYPYLKHFNQDQANLQYLFYQRFDHPENPLFSHLPRFSLGKFALKFFEPQRQSDESNLLSSIFQNSGDLSLIDRCQRIELETLLAGYLLSSQGDRMTMAHSVEGRCPFLDPDLVQLAQQIPWEKKLGGGFNEKLILKETFSSDLPEEVCRQAKQPYLAMESQSFIKHNPEWMNALINKQSIERTGLFNVSKVQKFFQKLMNNDIDKISPRENQTFIFILSSLLLFDQFIENFSQSNLDMSSCRIQTMHADRIISIS